MVDPAAYLAYLGGGVQSAEAMREAALISKAVEATKKDLGALPFGNVCGMTDENMMRRAIRSFIRFQKEADGPAEEAV